MVTKGINKYSDKDRRLQRRRNHIARDLATSKYRQQVLPDRKRKFINTEDEVYYDYNDSTDEE
jgi:hypothetical protein